MYYEFHWKTNAFENVVCKMSTICSGFNVLNMLKAIHFKCVFSFSGLYPSLFAYVQMNVVIFMIALYAIAFGKHPTIYTLCESGTAKTSQYENSSQKCLQNRCHYLDMQFNYGMSLWVYEFDHLSKFLLLSLMLIHDIFYALKCEFVSQSFSRQFKWFVAWQHSVETINYQNQCWLIRNTVLSHLSKVSQEIPQPWITKFISKIISLN